MAMMMGQEAVVCAWQQRLQGRTEMLQVALVHLAVQVAGEVRLLEKAAGQAVLGLRELYMSLTSTSQSPGHGAQGPGPRSRGPGPGSGIGGRRPSPPPTHPPPPGPLFCGSTV